MQLFNQRQFKFAPDDPPPGGGDPAPAPAPAPATAPDPKALLETLEAERAERRRADERAVAAETEAKKLREDRAEEDRRKLAEEGKFKELADQQARRASEAEAREQEGQKQLQKVLIDGEIKAQLILEGATDADVALLLDKSGIKVEGGRAVGVREAVQAFKSAKPHFFGPAKATRTSEGGLPPAPVPSGEEPEIKDVRGMPSDEYKEHKRKVLADFNRGKLRRRA
jgi:hypothetical protein